MCLCEVDSHYFNPLLTLEAYASDKRCVSSPSGNTYEIRDFLGKGIFGEVYTVQNIETGDIFALKMGKIRSGIKDQLDREIYVYEKIENLDEDDKMSFGTMIESFQTDKYIFIIMELYKYDLLNFLSKRNYNGVPLSFIQKVLRDIVPGILTLKNHNIIHCDLKLENLAVSIDSQVKIIDFGSSILEGETIPDYAQSRYYRAPEVILNLEKNYKVDIWSLGCIAVELYAGLPIFAGESEEQMLQLIQKRVGKFPISMIKKTPRMKEFFKGSKVKSTKRLYDKCYNNLHLEQIINEIKFASDNDDTKQMFISLVKGMLQIDPEKRFTIEEVSDHPFLQNDI